MLKGMVPSLYYSPSDVDLEKGEHSQDSASSVALLPPDPDVDMSNVQCSTPGHWSRDQELTNFILPTGSTQTRLQSISHRKVITTLFPSSPTPTPASGSKQVTISTSQSAKIPETQDIVSWSTRKQKRPVTLSESSDQKRTHDTIGEEDPDVHSEYEDNGYGVRSKVRVRFREPANVEILKTNFGEMSNKLQTVLQERASLQQRVDDISKQLDESIRVHEAMKTELEEVIQQAKRELEESQTRSRKELDEVLQRIGEENDVALGLARQETREHVEQLMLEREELIQRLQGELQSTVEERIEVEQARDAAIRDALASQSHVHREAMRAYAAEVEEKMNRKIKELADMHEQAMCERVTQDKVELDRKIKDIQENHKKQLNELYKSNDQSMPEHRDKHPPLEEVLAQHRPILRQEILKELSERYLHQVAEAEKARQELQKRVEDREKRLEMEVQNVKRLEEQLNSIENNRRPRNVDQMDIDVGPSQKALGKRPARSEMDGHTRLEAIHIETGVGSNGACTNLGPIVEVSECDENVDQIDVDSSSQNGLRRRPDRPETNTRRARLKAISKQNIRFHTSTPVHEWHQVSETIKLPERFRKPIGCAFTIANRLRIQTPCLTPIPSIGNQHLRSPSLAPPGILGSTPNPGPSTVFCRDTSPPLNPPGVYGSAHDPGPSTVFCRDTSPPLNPTGVYDTSETQPAASQGSISSQPSDIHPTSLTSVFQAFRGEMQDMRNVLNQLVQSRELSTTPRRIPHKHGNYKLNQSQRPRTNARNDLMKAVRDEMNQLLGIKRDTEIIDSAKTGVFADLDEAEKFDEGTIDAPPLEPLRVCWDNIKSLWNFHLADIFANHVVRSKPEYVSEEDHEEIAKHFMQRLESLRKELTKHLPKNDEERDEVQGCYQNKNLKTLHRKRIQRRQARLRSTRLEICKTGSAGGHNPAWDILALMVEKLGIDGNSSDETDDEDRSYAIRFREWRSGEVKRLLQFIDDNRTLTNAYGNNKPGNPPHKRVRKTYPPVTKDNPIARLPLNFYDKIWYDSLSPLQQTQLDPLPEMELPIIDD